MSYGFFMQGSQPPVMDGSPAAALHAMAQPPRIAEEDGAALLAEIERGKHPVRVGSTWTGTRCPSPSSALGWVFVAVPLLAFPGCAQTAIPAKQKHITNVAAMVSMARVLAREVSGNDFFRSRDPQPPLMDRLQAVAWARRAANRGHAPAMLLLADWLFRGYGSPNGDAGSGHVNQSRQDQAYDDTEATEWVRRAEAADFWSLSAYDSALAGHGFLQAVLPWARRAAQLGDWQTRHVLTTILLKCPELVDPAVADPSIEDGRQLRRPRSR